MSAELLFGALGLAVSRFLFRQFPTLPAGAEMDKACNLSVIIPARNEALTLPETLPDDIASTAERLWPTQPREALGLLYRGLLSRLLHDFNLPLKSADTEGEVLERIQRLQQPQLLAFSDELTRHWQNLAYGHRLPPVQAQQQLCSDWRTLFNAMSVVKSW